MKLIPEEKRKAKRILSPEELEIRFLSQKKDLVIETHGAYYKKSKPLRPNSPPELTVKKKKSPTDQTPIEEVVNAFFVNYIFKYRGKVLNLNEIKDSLIANYKKRGISAVPKNKIKEVRRNINFSLTNIESTSCWAELFCCKRQNKLALDTDNLFTRKELTFKY
jgi:hypothetical protein